MSQLYGELDSCFTNIYVQYLSKYLDITYISKQCRPRSNCSLREQFDQGLHCLPFCQHSLDTSPCSQTFAYMLSADCFYIIEQGKPAFFNISVRQMIHMKCEASFSLKNTKKCFLLCNIQYLLKISQVTGKTVKKTL